MSNPFARSLSAALNYTIASKQVSRERMPIGFLYREAAAFPNDSGWRVFSGMETDEYTDNPDNFDTLPLAEIVNTHPEIAELVQESEGAWEWDDEKQCFSAVADWQPMA